jgi:GGDEF domain-containing protein
MEFLLDLDLDWLCLAAEFAAGLLLLSMAWRPARESSTIAEASATTIDWEPVQAAFLHAVTSVGRCLSLRSNRIDEDRLQSLQREWPFPLRDRLTGTLNAYGMDQLHQAWCSEPDLHGYPSCYAAITLTDQDSLMEQHGAACVELALRRISELLVAAFSGQALLSRYQPNRFLLQFYGASLADCGDSINPILEQINAPEFFSPHDEAISIRCQAHYWFCNRSIETEELLQLLDDGGESISDVPCNPMQVSESSVDAEVTESQLESEAVLEKPFSVDDLAPFPSPWDDPPAESPPSKAGNTHAVQEGLEGAPTNADIGLTGQPDRELVPVVSTSDASESVEGFASPEDIASLLAQLQPKTASDKKDPLELESGEAQQGEPKLDTPPVIPESSKARSIYSDDLEDTVLKSDLASLFATVRASAAGDFGYELPPSTSTSLDADSAPR